MLKNILFHFINLLRSAFQINFLLQENVTCWNIWKEKEKGDEFVTSHYQDEMFTSIKRKQFYSD